MALIDRKNLILVGVVVVGVVGFSLFEWVGYQNRQKGASNVPVGQPAPSGREKQVSFNGDGFDPKEVTVKRGDTVVWTNNSRWPMWVGSDPHPSHTDHPGFDQRESGSQGSVYRYIFSQAGRFSYHNHINPGQRGTVIVEE